MIKDFAKCLGLTLAESLAFAKDIGFIFGLKDLAEGLKDTQVATIDLSANEIENEGAQALAESLKDTQITTINLDDNEIGDEGAQALAEGLKGTQVTTISLNSNNIGDKGAQALAEGLKSTQITTISLNSNNIGDKGAQALAEGLQRAQVTSLNLRNNYLNYQGIKKFTEKLDETFLLKVDLDYENYKDYEDYQAYENHENTVLSTLLKSNQDKLVLAPLYAAYLCYLKPEENKEYLHLPQLKENATVSEQLKFASGILMKVCPELQDKILGFFPLMNAARKKWILDLARKKFFIPKKTDNQDNEHTLCMVLEKL